MPPLSDISTDELIEELVEREGGLDAMKETVSNYGA